MLHSRAAPKYLPTIDRRSHQIPTRKINPLDLGHRKEHVRCCPAVDWHTDFATCDVHDSTTGWVHCHVEYCYYYYYCYCCCCCHYCSNEKRVCKSKRVKYIYWVKKDLFGCFRIEKNVTKTMKQV